MNFLSKISINKTITVSTIVSSSLLLILALLIYISSINPGNNVVHHITSFYGTLVATVIGVLLSFFLLSREQKAKEKKAMLGTLKLIWSELDINSMALGNILRGLQTMPKDIHRLANNFDFLLDHSKAFKDQVFYSTISSGFMLEITKNDAIFNATQQAYYNIAIMLNGLKLSQSTFIDFAAEKPINIPTDISQKLLDILEKDTTKVRSVSYLTNKAKEIMYDYLSKNGVTFTQEEQRRQEESLA